MSEVGRGEKTFGSSSPGGGIRPSWKTVRDPVTGRRRVLPGDGHGLPMASLDPETGQQVWDEGVGKESRRKAPQV